MSESTTPKPRTLKELRNEATFFGILTALFFPVFMGLLAAETMVAIHNHELPKWGMWVVFGMVACLIGFAAKLFLESLFNYQERLHGKTEEPTPPAKPAAEDK